MRQPSAFGQPNGNTKALAYDAIGPLVSKDTGTIALYDWTYNRAGQVLTAGGQRASGLRARGGS